jgi:hypothetical protein
MKRILLFLTAVTSLTIAANADIGDTITSSEAKYGKGNVTAPFITYVHNGWWIKQTYNANEVCVLAEFARLDGKPITSSQQDNLDLNNLPSYTLNPNGKGWVNTKWNNDSTFHNVISHLWSNSEGWSQVLSGQFRYGDDTKWFYGRTYITPAGNDIVRQENEKNNASQSNAKQTETTGSPDTNI